MRRVWSNYAPVSGRLHVFMVHALADNYVYLCEHGGTRFCVDPGEAAPVVEAMQEHGWENLDFILNTHHHADHTGGNKELQDTYGSYIVTGDPLKDRIPEANHGVQGEKTVRIDDLDVDVMMTPGHTRDHVCFYIGMEHHHILFSGDTLFSMGCGKLFEGTADEMYTSLKKLKHLPTNTRLFCGHEYTLKNAMFALTVEPGNTWLQDRYEKVKLLAAKRHPTIPVTIGEELLTNPFLRCDSAEIRQRLQIDEEAPNRDVFRTLRQLRDEY